MRLSTRSPVAASPRWHQPVLLALLAALSVAPAPAAAPANGIPGAAPTEDTIVFERSQVTVTAAADGSSVREVAAEVKINDDAGVRALAVLNFTYAGANEVADVNYVRVRKPDGSVIETPPANIQDMPADLTRAAPMYSDIREKHVVVKGLGVGDMLLYDIRFRTAIPQVPGQFWYEHAFLKGVLVKEEILEISVPAAMHLNISSPDARPSVREQDNRRIYRWINSNLGVGKPPATVDPGALAPPPAVQVTTFSSWAEVGHWLGELQREPGQVTPEIRVAAENLIRGLGTDEERIRALYNFVSLRFHYVGLDFGIGRYQPHAATEVLANRYGDCKDKHILLATLLNAAGYAAWPAFVHTLRQTDPDLPSPAQFNHVLTVVSHQGKLVWLDTTPEIAPYGMLLNVVRNKQALVVPDDGPPKLMQTPPDAPFPQEVQFAADGRLSADGVFTGHLDWDYRGDLELMVRAAFRGAPASQWQDIAQKLSYASGFGGTISNLHVSAPDDIDKPFHLSYEYERKGYSAWADRQITPPLPVLAIAGTAPDEAYQGPIYLGAPTRYVARSRLELPPPYTVLPPDRLDLDESFAEYHAEYAFEQGALTASRSLTTKTTGVTPAQWNSYLSLYRRMKDDQAQTITVQDGSAAAADAAGTPSRLVDMHFLEAAAMLKQQQFQRAQELFETVIAEDPGYRGAHSGLAVTLGTQRRFGEALAELRKEQQAWPQDVQNYHLAAGMLLYLDRKKEAIEEWRKALVVDPANRDAALALAGLLTATDQQQEAITVIEKSILLSADSPMLQLALGKAYAANGEPDKAALHLRTAAEMAGSGQQAAVILNEAAYFLAETNREIELARQFAWRALSEAESQSASLTAPDARLMYSLAARWDTVGWIGFRMGDLDLAEDYIRAAWLLSEAAEVGLHLGQVYEKLGRPREAARVYTLALTLHTTPNVYRQLLERARKLADADMGQAAATGKQQVPPAEQLRRGRHRQLENPSKLSGSADFYLVFSPAKVESVRHVRGEKSLKVLGDPLATLGLPVKFPRASTARILRQVTVTCEPAGPCDAALEPL